jgi:hypothetical protein
MQHAVRIDVKGSDLVPEATAPALIGVSKLSFSQLLCQLGYQMPLLQDFVALACLDRSGK